MKNILFIILYYLTLSNINGQTNDLYKLKIDYEIQLNFNEVQEFSSTLFLNKEESLFEYKNKQQSNEILLKENSDSQNSYTFNISDKNNYFIKYNKLTNEIFHLEKGLEKENFLLIKENFERIDWEILDEKKKIGKYDCQKAIGFFRGRNYEVWFTFSIPSFFGPWKFHGLPGLILQATDKENEVNFIAKSINNVLIENNKIPFNQYKIITRKDYNIMLNKKIDGIESKIGSRLGRGIKVTMTSKKINSIERYEN